MSRMRESVCAVLAVGAALAATSFSYAQPPDRQERREDRRDVRQARRAKDILGSRINIQVNMSVGTVDDIVLSDDGYVEYLVVLNEGKYVLVPWEAARFDFPRRTATAEITRERFREVPTFTQEQWPN